VRQYRIPARGVATVNLAAGALASIIDLAGHQGADCIAVTPDGRAVSSTQLTRAHNLRLFPAVGDVIYADSGAPMLTLMEDTSPGPHGLLVPPCDPTMYRLRGAGCAHASCHDNLHRALAAQGLSLGRTPPSLCLFQNLRVAADGGIVIGVNESRAGDRVVLRAEQALILAVSACPNDLFKKPPLQPSDLLLCAEP
jgi:uncharacterized protein YcgI (DUF1989 family)